MTKFAKIFEVMQTQIVYVLNASSEGYPQIEISTLVDGINIRTCLIFETENELLAFDFQKASQLAQHDFDKKDKQQAQTDYEQIVALLKGG